MSYGQQLPGVDLPANPILVGAKLRPLPVQNTPIASFAATYQGGAAGVTIAARIGVALQAPSIQLLRGANPDVATATVVQTWTGPFAAQQPLEYTDGGAASLSVTVAYYWLRLIYDATVGNVQTLGPTPCILSTATQGSWQIGGFSASVSPGANGTVTIGVTFQPPASANFGSVQIAAVGYNGISGSQIVAQSARTGFSFTMKATGEHVTLTGRGVNLSGEPQTGGPTQLVTLAATESAPCVVYGATAVTLSTGNQITWPASPEADATYSVYRAPVHGAFSAATLVAGAIPHGVTSLLDAIGNPASYAYYITATNPGGTSAPSPAIVPGAQLTVAGQGTGASVSPVVYNNQIIACFVTNGGSGYFATPLVSFSGSATLQNASGTVLVDGAGHVTSIAMTNGGNYGTGSNPSASIHY